MPRPLSRWLPAGRTFRPILTQLEDRVNPATVTEAGAALNLDLAAAETRSRTPAATRPATSG